MARNSLFLEMTLRMTGYLFIYYEILHCTVYFLYYYAYLQLSLLSFNYVFCDGIEDLPIAMQFDGLGNTDNFAAAVKTLRGLAGVYAIKCYITGAIYIGSTMNLLGQPRKKNE